MTPYQKRLNPYIRRMAEDMQLRNFADATIDAYTYHANKFCEFFGKFAEELGPEEIRQYQLYLVNEKKASWSSFNQAVCGLRFLYEITLERRWAVRHIPFGKRPKKLPIVLSDEEATPREDTRYESRTWKDKSGKFSVTAKFNGFMGGKTVILLKEDGSKVRVPLEKLSSADQTYIEGL